MKITVPQANHDSEIEIDVSSWSDEFRAYMMAYAFRVRLQRCTASVEPGDHKKVRQETWDEMVQGILPDGKGGGLKLSPELAGWIEFYKSKNSTQKIKGIIPSRKTIDHFHTLFVRDAIWPSVRNAIKDMTQEDQRKFMVEKVPGLIEKHKEQVLAQAEQDTKPGRPGDFIESEKRKRLGATTDKDRFTVQIQIEL